MKNTGQYATCHSKKQSLCMKILCIYINMYVYIYMCVCVSACMCFLAFLVFFFKAARTTKAKFEIQKGIMHL